jgi:hypothetical protein
MENIIIPQRKQTIGWWVPGTRDFNRIPASEKLEQATYGTDNKHYIKIIGVEPVLVGRFQTIKYDPTNDMAKWAEIEEFVERVLNTYDKGSGAWCFKTGESKTRNIDFQRMWWHEGKIVYQSIEVKKTTGNMIFPPQYILSSEKQFHELFKYKYNPLAENSQIAPSIYLIVSWDYNQKGNYWVLTLWAVPLLNPNHFKFINTSVETVKNRRPIDKTLMYTF